MKELLTNYTFIIPVSERHENPPRNPTWRGFVFIFVEPKFFANYLSNSKLELETTLP